MGFQYLRSLIDYCQIKMLDTKQMNIPTQCRSSPDKDPCTGYQFPDSGSITTDIHLILQKIRLVSFIARYARAYTDKIDMMLHQFATDLINRTIRIRNQKNGLIGLHQGLFQDIHQSKRRFPGPGRSDQYEIILRLLGHQHQMIELRRGPSATIIPFQT